MKASALRRFGTIHPSGSGIVLSALSPAYRSGRTIFSSRVFEPVEVQRVLKTGQQSRKIGKQITKGRRRGWPIFTLTLEERATCPRSCTQWANCYGNNMQAAERIVAGPELEEALLSELAALQAAHPAGFLVRLHVLGDFYSAGYVDLWRRALTLFPALHVFGFTAHDPASEIGRPILQLAVADWNRFAVRFSGSGLDRLSSEVVDDLAQARGIVCPAQTGGTDCCATCALCWHSDRTITFLRH